MGTVMAKDFLNSLTNGVGFIQVGNQMIPAKGEISISSTGEQQISIQLEYNGVELWSDTKTMPMYDFRLSKTPNKKKKKKFEKPANLLMPVQIIFNDTTTTCIFYDETKFHSKPTSDDEFDPEVGVAMCIMKKLYGSRSAFDKVISKGYFQEPKKVKPAETKKVKGK